ncbi:hypothetical protein I5Q34_12730 [Streptomyces sp. AV19]|uniref:DUF6255 family natural product biosynthesis protein n=1 Tax=Streptomyces sp. AV19 TaxID=2793068 RepID=UPI0018FE4BD9|nr:DUF6255 family natural product biosynthesis protein [Streptomyces sp. AV19]MBH1935127.1 hypothetical protein [Streptomyces sp. AV19]MDG4531060.1 DUF6255 family natural product biosynthesis protein [Streptomyces sp. AV19]
MNTNCPHSEGWTPLGGGARRCDACGVERHDSYGPLRLPPDDGLGRKTGTERAVAAATAIALLGTRFLEERARLLRRHRHWAVAA